MSTARDALLSACTRRNLTPVKLPEDLAKEFPELDNIIFVRVLDAGERHLYSSVSLDARSNGGSISDYEVAAICACEADGTPMFHRKDDAGRISIEAAEIEKLRRVDGRVIYEIAKLALDVSGMTVAAKAAAKKDSPSEPTTDSSSG